MRKLLYAGQDGTVLSDLRSRLDGCYGLHVCASGAEATEDFLAFLPEILIVDTNFPGCDIIGLLHTARTRRGQTKVIVLAGSNCGHISDSLQHIGVDALLVQPVSADDVIAAIESFEASGDVTLQDRIDGVLQRLGLDCGGDGFVFLREAILYKYANPACLFTTDLCVHVAKLYNTTAQSIDKTMSRCIHKAWKRRNPVLWARYFPGCTKTVTCNVFINAISVFFQTEEER